MRLIGIHKLHVSDLNILENVFNEDDKPKSDNKLSGNRKNETAPISKAYKSSGKSQEEIADIVGVDPSTISRYKSKEKDIERKPSFDTLKRLTAAVGTKVSSLFPELGH